MRTAPDRLHWSEAKWLKAGVVERGCFAPTDEGPPQGGVISPTLMNIALHGLEEAAGVRYCKLGGDAAQTVPGSPALVRYADDLVALCHSRDQVEQVKARLAEWLAPRGLTFNEDKTHIIHVSAGFDFLGFNVRRYPNGKGEKHVATAIPPYDAGTSCFEGKSWAIRNDGPN